MKMIGTLLIGNYEMMFKCMEGSCFTHAYSFVAMWDAKSPEIWSSIWTHFPTGVLTLLSCTEKTQLHIRLRSPYEGINPWRHDKLPINWCFKISAKDRVFNLRIHVLMCFFKTGFLHIFGWYTSRIQVYGKSAAVLSALSLQFASSCSHLSHEDLPVFLMSFAGNMGFSWGHWNSVCPCL